MSKQIRRIAFLCLSLCIGFGQVIYANSYTFADDTEITGNVTDTDGEPLVGVNIRVKDRIIGTSTDFNGNFGFHPEGLDTTKFKGYQTISAFWQSSEASLFRQKFLNDRC